MGRQTRISVKQTGRLQKPRLDQGQLTDIGMLMVARQKERWSHAVNAEGNPAKPLSKKYFFLKRKMTGNSRPVRDMKLTGLTRDNFSLRKAIDGVIRAENTTREGRMRAQRAQGYDEMIGFSGPEQSAIFKHSQSKWGEYMRKAWVDIG